MVRREARNPNPGALEMACNRCKGTSSNPFNFLISCSECGKNWHHRERYTDNSPNSSDYFYLRLTGCHIPPLGDPELIALIRATNDNDVDNGLSSWTGRCCRRNRKKAITEVGIFDRSLRCITSVQASKEPQWLRSFCTCC
jgi:hypothetical protein